MSKSRWILDPAYGEVQFKVKYLMISNVIGRFRRFDLTVETDDKDFSTSKVVFSADVDSVETDDHQRDGHLKSPDFFDVNAYPHILFEGGSIVFSGDEGTLDGMLTIRDITRPITIKVEFGGFNRDSLGKLRAGFSFIGKINRKDFGLAWNTILKDGGVMVGNEVRISGEIQLIRQ
ncbi:MAG: polyisoprenoid-binding protein [Saprospiraceae bacterium]|nr:polyisoprenoid-binding protein [Saprospiraceae bacterium]